MSYDDGLRERFDSFIKKCLVNYSKDYDKKTNRIRRKEKLVENMEELITDIKSEPIQSADFNVLGILISINNSELLDALTSLSNDKQLIILLSFYFDMTDEEIGRQMSRPRKTINYNKLKAIKELREFLSKYD